MNVGTDVPLASLNHASVSSWRFFKGVVFPLPNLRAKLGQGDDERSTAAIARIAWMIGADASGNDFDVVGSVRGGHESALFPRGLLGEPLRHLTEAAFDVDPNQRRHHVRNLFLGGLGDDAEHVG